MLIGDTLAGCNIMSVSMKCDRCGRMHSLSDISFLKNVPICYKCRAEIWDNLNDLRTQITITTLEEKETDGRKETIQIQTS